MVWEAACATFGFLNEGLNHGFGRPRRLPRATLTAAVSGGLAAAPFAFLSDRAGHSPSEPPPATGTRATARAPE